MIVTTTPGIRSSQRRATPPRGSERRSGKAPSQPPRARAIQAVIADARQNTRAHLEAEGDEEPERLILLTKEGGALVRAFEGIVSDERREAILDALLAEFSITHLRRTPALALSGGERRRVEIARALASNPHFVLLDEPFAGIDPIAVGDIRDLVAQLKDRGIGVLITDHNVRETLAICEKAYIVGGGHIIAEGTASEVLANEKVRAIYLGDDFQL